MKRFNCQTIAMDHEIVIGRISCSPEMEHMFCYNKRPRSMTTLIKTLLRKLGLEKPHENIRFEQNLMETLRELSVQERRPTEEIAADLLTSALHQREIQGANVEIWQSLTPREQEVAALSCLQYTHRGIAVRLHISTTTVKTHIRNVLRKFNVQNKAQLQQLLTNWDFSSWEGPEK